MTETRHVCPRCDHLLVPVHAVEGRERRVIALICPEPYCDHELSLPPDQAPDLERQRMGRSPGSRRDP